MIPPHFRVLMACNKYMFPFALRKGAISPSKGDGVSTTLRRSEKDGVALAIYRVVQYGKPRPDESLCNSLPINRRKNSEDNPLGPEGKDAFCLLVLGVVTCSCA